MSAPDITLTLKKPEELCPCLHALVQLELLEWTTSMNTQTGETHPRLAIRRGARKFTFVNYCPSCGAATYKVGDA